MRRLLALIILAAILMMGGPLSAFEFTPLDKSLTDKLEASAKQLTNSLANGDAATPAFKAAWQQQVDKRGTLKRIGPGVVVQKKDNFLCNAVLTFSGGTIIQHTVFDKEHRIIDLSFLDDPLSPENLPPGLPADVTTKLEALAKQLTNYMASGNEAAALALMNKATQINFKGRLKAVWQQQLDKLGNFESSGLCMLIQKNDKIVGNMTLNFSGGTVVQSVIFDKEHRIAGLSFLLATPH